MERERAMEETQAMHQTNLEWGCITNIINKLSDLEDSIDGGWPELVDMVADAVTAESTNKDAVDVFFSLYQFLFRLYYRVKNDPEPKPFNIIRDHTEQNAWRECFEIYNYGYETFKWARNNGYGPHISNTTILVPKNSLNDKQRIAFERKSKEVAQ